MTLRIVKRSQGELTILALCGRIQAADVEEIQREMNGTLGMAMDLEEVTLVDLDVVRFLGRSEAAGVVLMNCSPYVRAWIFRERETDIRDWRGEE
jgi:hypothetical protein